MKTRKQRARNTEKTQEIRVEYSIKTLCFKRFKVLNVRFKRLNNSKRILSV